MGYLIGLAQLAGRSGCPEWDFVLTRGGVHRGCDAGSDFSGSSPNGFDIGKGGAEYALTQLLLAVAFLLTGPGSYSLAFWLPAPLRKF